MTDVPGGDLLGRAGDLAAVRARVRRADDGVGSLVLVSGEAGIGKTALCERAVADAVGKGHRTGWVSCWQSAPMPALRPWSMLLAQIAPAGGETLTGGAACAADPVAARLAQADAVTQLLIDAARERPLVLVVDDLHWADAATVELLAHVATVIRGMRVVLLVTYRPEDAGPATPFGRQLARLHHHSSELPLAPLDDTAVAAILARGIDGWSRAQRTATGLVRMARGNPLFAIELARLVTADGIDLDTEVPAVPRSVRDLAVARLEMLSPECARLLERAAVIGDEVPLSLLADFGGLPADGPVAILEQAVDRSFVRVRHQGTYEFTHPLLRAAVYDSMTTARRVDLHARIGAALEARHNAGLPVDPAVLAHHFGRAAPSGTAAKAVGYAVDAGDQSMRMAAYATAASRFRQALTVADTDPSAGDRVAILLGLGEAQSACGETAAARATFGAAADGARAAGRGRDLAAAALGCSGGAGIEVPIDDRALIALLSEAREQLDADDVVLRARLCARLSVALTLSAPLERRAALAAEAVHLATAADDPDALAHALAARCDVLAGPADVEERHRSARRIIELARLRDNVAVELLGRRLLVVALLERGRLNEAELAVQAFARASDRLRDPRYALYVPLWRGTLALARGDLPAYRRHRASLAPAVTAAATENATTLAAVQEIFAAVDFDQERVPALFSRLSGQVTTVEAAVAVTTAAMCHLAGRPDEARALMESVTPDLLRW
ncbi:MAG: AAA family ATPase [Pseudonocardia sp.]|nr:AAA family ATPase [Pseudonocardia sp.]